MFSSYWYSKGFGNWIAFSMHNVHIEHFLFKWSNWNKFFNANLVVFPSISCILWIHVLAPVFKNKKHVLFISFSGNWRYSSVCDYLQNCIHLEYWSQNVRTHHVNTCFGRNTIGTLLMKSSPWPNVRVEHSIHLSTGFGAQTQIGCLHERRFFLVVPRLFIRL